MLIPNFARGLILAALLVPFIGFCPIGDNLAPLDPGYRANDGIPANCATGNTGTFGRYPSRGGSEDPNLAVATGHY